MPVTKEFKTIDEQMAKKDNIIILINGFEIMLLKDNVANKEYENVYDKRNEKSMCSFGTRHPF